MVTALYDGNNSNKTPVAAIQPILTSEEMVNLPIEELLVRNLQYLRRSGLISVDWSKRTIKCEKPLIKIR